MVTLFLAIGRGIGSTVTVKKIIRIESTELVDISRYFIYCLTPSECGAIKHQTRAFFSEKKSTDRVLNDFAL